METENETPSLKRNFTQSLESLKDPSSKIQLDIMNLKEQKGSQKGSQKSSQKASQILSLLEDNSDDESTLVRNKRGVPKDASAATADPSEEPIELIRLDGHKKMRAHKLMIQGIEVWFPFEPYDVQVAYMTKVIDALNGSQNALLQSPTGTGKTLCLLCAALAWMNHYRNHYIQNPEEKEEYKPVKIYYASRTHSQIKQVIKELKQTCYRPATAILGSKEQQCVKSDFLGLQRFQITAACKSARFSPIQEQRCQYYDSYNRNKAKFLNDQKTLLNDIEELAAQGQKEHFCPYFLERDLTEKADIVMLPYNYVLDGRVRDAMNISLTNAIMIFDEAHNLERLTEDGCSFKLSTKDMDDCELDIKLIKQKMKRSEECKLTEEELKQLEYPVMCLKKNLENMKRSFSSSYKMKKRPTFQGNEDSKTTVDEGRMIFQFFKENTCGPYPGPENNPFREGIDDRNLHIFINLVVKAIDDLSNVAISRGGIDCLGFAAMIISNLLHIDDEAGSEDLSWEQNHVNSYMFQTEYEDDDDGPEFSFSLSCLYPGIGFEFVLRQDPRSIVLTSGTLAPLRSFEAEFATRFPVKLENNHVIDTKTQCATFIVRSGPSGYPLNFSYDKRDDRKTYIEMGNTLLSIARQVPNGVLVCFASYGMMNKCLDIWENSEGNLLKKIEAVKTIHKEPRRQTQLNTTMAKYTKEAKAKGAILCCVCRGKVSEGIDFADEMARAVVLIGIPFPAVGDQRVSYKKAFLSNNQHLTGRISGNQWYMQQTIRAINQALGRVIRHIKDYGMVFLCDARYGEYQFKNEFPGWITDNLEISDKFGLLLTKTSSFFKEKSQSNSLNKLFSQSNKLKSSMSFGDKDKDKDAASVFDSQASQPDSATESTQIANASVNEITNKYKQLDLASNVTVQSSYDLFKNGNTKKVKLNTTEQSANKSPIKQASLLMPSSTLNAPQTVASAAMQEKPREPTVTFECPKCHKHTKVIMKANCGHLACEGCWKYLMIMSPKCPVCKGKISSKELVKVTSMPENLIPIPSPTKSPVKETIPIVQDEKPKQVIAPPVEEKNALAILMSSQSSSQSQKSQKQSITKQAETVPSATKPKSGFPRLGTNQQSNRSLVSTPRFLEDHNPAPAEVNRPVFFEEEAQLIEETNKSNIEGAECMVCYQTESKNMLVAKCGHCACKQCWACIFLRRSACPTCKKNVTVEDLLPLK